MRSMFYDFETTGIPQWSIPSEDPCQPHIVQIGAILHDPITRTEALIDVIVRPDGWEIPEETVALHGITMERAMDEGIPEKDAIDMLVELWRQADQRVGHNERFDARICRIGLKRYFGDDLADEFKAGAAECTGLLAKPIMCLPPKGRYGWKMPSLAEAYQHFIGGEIRGAHNALADTRACMQVYYAIKASKQAA